MRPSAAVKHDLRQEPRIPAHGVVMLEYEGRSLAAQLLDLSVSGFRAGHDFVEFHTGSTVGFRHPGASGRARVVWNRISGTSVESGFFIIS